MTELKTNGNLLREHKECEKKQLSKVLGKNKKNQERKKEMELKRQMSCKQKKLS